MQSNFDRMPESRDISLVDLTVIIVRRWKLFLLVLLCGVLATVGYVFVATEKQTSIGVYQLAKDGDGKHLTDAASVVSRMSSVWVPDLVLQHENEGNLAPSVTVSNPDNTGLIRLQTLAPENQSDLVASIHKDLLERLDGWQVTVFRKTESGIERRINRHVDAIEEMLKESGPSEAVAVLVEDKIKLEYRLDRMEKGEILSVASRGEDDATTSRALIVVVGLLAAIVVATLLSFLAEFVSVVRKRAMGES